MNVPKVLFESLFLWSFKYGEGAKFWGYVVTNAEQLRVEFYNFVPCRHRHHHYALRVLGLVACSGLNITIQKSL
jgi:hypothetical protein